MNSQPIILIFIFSDMAILSKAHKPSNFESHNCPKVNLLSLFSRLQSHFEETVYLVTVDLQFHWMRNEDHKKVEDFRNSIAHLFTIFLAYFK